METESEIQTERQRSKKTDIDRWKQNLKYKQKDRGLKNRYRQVETESEIQTERQRPKKQI